MSTAQSEEKPDDSSADAVPFPAPENTPAATLERRRVLFGAAAVAGASAAAFTPRQATAQKTTKVPQRLDVVAPSAGDYAGIGQGAQSRTVHAKLTDIVSVKDFGAVGNGVADDSRAVITALNAAEAVYFPAGTYAIYSKIDYEVRTNLTLFAHRDATIYIATGASFTFFSSVKVDSRLADDVSQYSNFIVLDKADGVEFGDLIHIVTATALETGWKYHKQCIRRVSGVDGRRVYLDQVLDFPFTVAEGTSINFAKAVSVHIDGLNLICGRANPYVRFLRLCQSSWNNATLEGSVPAWAHDWSDVIYTVACDKTTYENVTFRNARYAPQITQGSRFTVVRNFVAERVRHLDCNSWAQDTLLEDGRGIQTSGIIQSHPSIRTTFRNIHDGLVDPLLHGLDLRGVGEIVQDCSAASTAGIGINTNRALFTPEWTAWAQSFDRRIIRFRSPTAGISCGFHRMLYIESCDVPYIKTDIVNYKLLGIFISPDTRTALPSNIEYADHGKLYQLPPSEMPVTVTDGWAFAASPTPITAITSANPCSVTCAGHSLSNGDVVRITSLKGMRQLNSKYFIVSNYTYERFDLRDLHGNAVDSRHYEPYLSGGYVTKQKATRACLLCNQPFLLNSQKLMFVMQNIYSETKPSEGSKRSITVQIYTEFGKIPILKQIWSKLIIRARCSSGYAESGYNVLFSKYPELLSYVIKGDLPSTEIGGVSIGLENANTHFRDKQMAEGFEHGLNGSDYYWFFDLTVSLPTGSVVHGIDVVVEAYYR